MTDEEKRAKNRERVRKWRAANPERNRELRRKWDDDHREQKRAADRAYGAENREMSSERARKWRAENSERERARQRANHLKRKYNLTPEQYDHMWREQGGLCAITKRPMITPAVDHCHETGKVRALVEQNLNAAMGMANDNPELLRLAADYLEQHATATKDA
jgi:Recombination endonuclease VII